MAAPFENTNPVAEFVPSSYQQALFDWIVTSTGSAIVEAVAGAGKTTTIIQALNFIPTNLAITFLAFNKDIVKELNKRLPAHVNGSTFHSIALKAWCKGRGYGNVKVEDDNNKKTRDIFYRWVDAYVARRHGDDTMRNGLVEAYGDFVIKLVTMAKHHGVAPSDFKGRRLVRLKEDSFDNFMDIVDHYEITFESEAATYEAGIKIAREVLTRSIQEAFEGREDLGCKSYVDFNDMLYMTLIANTPFPLQDWILVDECQDSNPVRRALVKRMLRKGGRCVFVGDRHQAIYGFTGADPESMDRIVEEFNCITLPLTISYRCPKAVVEFARQWVKHIESAPNAPEGSVSALATYTPETFRSDDVILCRLNAPLVAMAFQLFAHKVPCKIAGRDFGKQVLTLVKNMKAVDIDDLKVKLEAYRTRELTALSSQGKENAAQTVDDKVESVLVVIDGLAEVERTIAGLNATITKIFDIRDEQGNKKQVLTLSTVHKAKGKEWRRVFALDRLKTMPSKWARQAWQQVQEINLLYVMATRAKEEFIDITCGSWAEAA